MLSELSIVCKCDSCDLNYASLLSNIRSGIQFQGALEKISGHSLKSDLQKRRGEKGKKGSLFIFHDFLKKSNFTFWPNLIFQGYTV